MAQFLSEEYWEGRYNAQQIGWDIGEVSRPIKEYIDQLENKELRILIPGCGNGYEGEYLFLKGFHHVTLLDFAEQPLKNFKDRNPDFPNDHLIVGDFFKHKEEYDLILEQTLFCAIDPSKRAEYVKKSSELLAENGKLAGVLFNTHFENGPPFGGSIEEYNGLFNGYFRELSIKECYNSIQPRSGKECFLIAKK